MAYASTPHTSQQPALPTIVQSESRSQKCSSGGDAHASTSVVAENPGNASRSIAYAPKMNGALANESAPNSNPRFGMNLSRMFMLVLAQSAERFADKLRRPSRDGG